MDPWGRPAALPASPIFLYPPDSRAFRDEMPLMTLASNGIIDSANATATPTQFSSRIQTIICWNKVKNEIPPFAQCGLAARTSRFQQFQGEADTHRVRK